MSGTASEQITHREESQEGGQEAAHQERQKQAGANWDQATLCMRIVKESVAAT